jgi:hypothetical protein
MGLVMMCLIVLLCGLATEEKKTVQMTLVKVLDSTTARAREQATPAVGSGRKPFRRGGGLSERAGGPRALPGRHFRVCLYAPLNWLDRTLFGSDGPARGIRWGLSK